LLWLISYITLMLFTSIWFKRYRLYLKLFHTVKMTAHECARKWNKNVWNWRLQKQFSMSCSQHRSHYTCHQEWITLSNYCRIKTQEKNSRLLNHTTFVHMAVHICAPTNTNCRVRVALTQECKVTLSSNTSEHS
jgi:hypothetical protein